MARVKDIIGTLSFAREIRSSPRPAVWYESCRGGRSEACMCSIDGRHPRLFYREAYQRYSEGQCVSSTAPRFEARCPPVPDITFVINGLISAASSTSWGRESFFRSAGEFIVSRSIYETLLPTKRAISSRIRPFSPRNAIDLTASSTSCSSFNFEAKIP